MAYYRLYFLNERTGHVDRFEEFDASDDEAAVARAHRLLGTTPLELWSGGRKVSRLDPLNVSVARRSA